jgi:hypothetical protein
MLLLAALSGCADRAGTTALRHHDVKAIAVAEPSPQALLQTYADLDNYDDLHARLLDPATSEKALPIAVERALLLAGPTRLFTDVRADAVREPVLFESGTRRSLLERSTQAHVDVDAIYIDEKDMPRSEAIKILQQVAARLAGGETLDSIYAQVQAEHSYDDGDLHLTRIGNMGQFVLSEQKRNAFPFRWITVPEPDVKKLLAALPGAAVICEDNGGPRRVVLYAVRDLYRPQ